VTQIKTVVSRRNRVLNKGEQIRTNVTNAMENKIRPMAIRRSEARVADWDHKPKIFARKNYAVMRMSLWVHPGGSNERFWLWTSKGTKAHLITAKNAARLRFRDNYQARTLPGGLYNVGSGRSTGAWRAPVTVNHPGTAPRDFEKYIAEEMQEFFDETIQQAVLDAYAQ